MEISCPLKIVLFLLHCAQSANILGVFFYPSISHQSIFQAIWKELSLRGHQTTVVTPIPLNDPELTNLTEINVNYVTDIVSTSPLKSFLSNDKSAIENFANVFNGISMITEAILQDPEFQKLLQDKEKKFDLILIQAFAPALYGLSSRFNAPGITVSSLDVTTVEYELVGNPTHPMLYSNFLVSQDVEELSFIQRTKRVIWDISIRLYYRYSIVPKHQKLAEKYIGKNTPHLTDLQKNVSLLIENGNNIIYTPRPTVPSVIRISRLHIKPIKPLPEDLQKLLDEASEGVIYFSLGSNIKSVNLSLELRSKIVIALSELPYKILFKWESDYMPDQPKNVITRKWLPQQDVLAHRNIKVFVTQGGLQSIEEAIDRGVPLVGMPFYADQPLNMFKLSKFGAALRVNPNTMTSEELKEAIMEVATNPKYKKKVEEMSEILKDEPLSSLEKVMWWCEYVIRHKGTPHMRAPLADMSWYRYLLVDVVAALLLLIIAVTYVCYKLIAMLFVKHNLNYKQKTQ